LNILNDILVATQVHIRSGEIYMKTHKSIIIIVLMLLLALPAMAVSAGAPQFQSSAAMTLTSPMPNPVMIGGEVTFDLAFSVANINPGVAGAEIYLSYNPLLVAPPATPGVAAVEVLPDFFGVSNVSINEVLSAAQCPGSTGLPCIHLVVAGPAQTYQSGIAARFHFRAVDIGSACFDILSSKMVDADGFQVEHTRAQQICRPIQGRNTTGIVLRQGTPANPNPGAGTLACSNVTATGTWPYSVKTGINGNFILPNLPTGTYKLRAIYSGYLAAEKGGFVIPNNSLEINAGTVTLIGGDVNADNAINILDIGAIISKFGKTGVAVGSVSANCTASDEPADINDDGNVNISDLAIAAGNWSRIAPMPWQ
jgi:hypothetical protein